MFLSRYYRSHRVRIDSKEDVILLLIIIGVYGLSTYFLPRLFPDMKEITVKALTYTLMFTAVIFWITL